MAKITLTQGLIKSLFDYDNGFLYWKLRLSPNTKIGYPAGCIHENESGIRRVIVVYKKQYPASRLIFLWHKGYMPKIVDHKDRNKLNDNIENLRPATPRQNNSNVSKRQIATSKYLGVSLNNRKDRWRADVRTKEQQIYLGIFKTEEEAAIAYNEAAKIHHGEFANLNII